MTYALDTAIMCFLGWTCHWLWSWWERWKTQQMSLIDFFEQCPPAFWFSVCVTVSSYLIGPGLFQILGIVLPETPGSEALKLFSAYAVGWMADSVVYKFFAGKMK